MPAKRSRRPSTPKSATKPPADDDSSPIIFVRCNDEENQRYRAAFKKSGLRTYSDWVRQQLWRASE